MDLDSLPLLPLTLPGLPPPGLSFVAHATALGDPPVTRVGKKKAAPLASHGHILLQLIKRAVYVPGFQLVVTAKKKSHNVEFLPGGLLGFQADGPLDAEVVFVGKHPGDAEFRQCSNFVGQAARPLYQALHELKVDRDEYQKWYFTNVVKFKPPRRGDTLDREFIDDCMHLVMQEIGLIRPKFICCLGAEAGSAFYGRKIKIGDMAGRVLDYRYAVGPTADDFEVAKLMVIQHPASVFYNPDQMGDFVKGLSMFLRLLRREPVVSVEVDRDYRVLRSKEELGQVVDMILADPDPKSRCIAIDAEWHGNAPGENGSFLRTIQFSHKAKHAYCVALRGQWGVPIWEQPQAALPQLTRLLKSTPSRSVRIGGHYLRSDIPWLLDYGLDLRPEYAVPGPVSCSPADLQAASQLTLIEGGFDTGPAAHAYLETQSRGLEALATRLLSFARYDVPLEKWKEAFFKKLPRYWQQGYGALPDADWWWEYCLCDADVPRRIADRFGLIGERGLLDADTFGNDCRVPYYVTMLSQPSLLSMEARGLTVDTEQLAAMSTMFLRGVETLYEEFVTLTRWPGFGIGKDYHIRELLFGEEHNGSRQKRGRTIRFRPEGAACFYLDPVRTTGGKSGRDWAAILDEPDYDDYVPAADRETLGIYSHKFRPILLLRQMRFLKKATETFLRTPDRDIDGKICVDHRGVPIYSKGFLQRLGDDGCVHTTYDFAETGRLRSMRPNCQNLSSRRNKDYARALGSVYRAPVRTIIAPSPGFVIVEADYKSAELVALANEAGDQAMIRDVMRSMLPESHPDYRDFHAATAVEAFHLDCGPTPAELDRIGRGELRVAAKNVNFGIPYGRHAQAIARQCWEEGVDVTVESCEQLRQNYLRRYADVAAYLDECAAAAERPGFIKTAFGRVRHAPFSDDRKILEKIGREFRNFRIQGDVADAVALALYNVSKISSELSARDPQFNLLLQLHDALIFETRLEHTQWLVDTIIRPSMCDLVDVFPGAFESPDNRRYIATAPFRFDIDVKIYNRWYEPLSAEQKAFLQERSICL